MQGIKASPECGHLTGGLFRFGRTAGYLRRLVQLSVVWTRPEGGPIRAGRFPIGSGGWRGERRSENSIQR